MIYLIVGFAAALLATSVFEYGMMVFPRSLPGSLTKHQYAIFFWSVFGVLAITGTHPLAVLAAAPVALSHVDLAKRHASHIMWSRVVRNIVPSLRTRFSQLFR
jgi:hypothetical protein